MRAPGTRHEPDHGALPSALRVRGPGPRHVRRARRGMTLMELLVALAIVLALAVVLVPSVSSIFELRQRKAAKDLVLLYQQLHDEAVLRNATFRVVYDLRNNSYKVEVTEGGALVYSSAEQRERLEKERERLLTYMSDEEKAARARREQPFQELQGHFRTSFELPRGVRLQGVYTPQYERMITVDDVKEGEEGSGTVFSYVFANGFTERTLVWFVDERDPTKGWTVEVEPLSGRVRLYGELVDWRDVERRVPESGPTLPT